MKKDTLYRLKNNECMPWRNLLLNVAKQFQKLVNRDKDVAEKAAFIFDDTIDIRTGRKSKISLTFMIALQVERKVHSGLRT